MHPDKPIFVTGTGTGVGKTLVAAIITEALQADYWKPVQAGYENGTDSQWVNAMVENRESVIHPEKYILTLPASPHIAARNENKIIEKTSLQNACADIRMRRPGRSLIIEGAGGLLVPLSDNYFVADLVTQLDARLIIVSRNYLGSINHSLLTANACSVHGITDAAWIFNDQYLDYEDEIVKWSALPKIATIPYCYQPDAAFVSRQAREIAPALRQWLDG